MGTRGAFGFHINGEDKITYNHFDSYPEGLGDAIVAFLRKVDVEKLKKAVEAIQMVDGKSAPSADDIYRLQAFADTEVSTGQLDEWYVLLRQTQGDVAKVLAAGVMIEGKDFLTDSLFCEWAYVINLDTTKLEVYRGFQNKRHTKGRYAKWKGKKIATSTYYPVALVSTFKLSELPKKLSEVLTSTGTKRKRKATV